MASDQDDLTLRKRARRRLIGAVLLTILVVLVLPLILEERLTPLGDGPSVGVQQPASQTGPTTAAPDALPDASISADAVPVENAPAAADAAATPAAPATASPQAAAKPPATEPSAASALVKREPRTDTVAAVRASREDVPAAPEKPAEAPVQETPKGGAYLLQLGVFREEANARELANKATAAGLKPTVAQLESGAWRVGAGPFASREEARAARDKARAAGLEAVVKAP